MICQAHHRLDHPKTDRCYSPTACNAFGYCRERNYKYGIPSDDKTIEQWKKEDNQ